MFHLGDWAYRAKLQHSQVEVTCPDCFGRRALRVVLGDDSEVTVECAGCRLGYEPPRGYVHEDRTQAATERVQITKIEMETNNGVPITYYGGEGLYRTVEADLFTNVETAQVRADALQLEHEQEKRARMQRKEKTTHDWAWHVTYHRRCIKQAQRELDYHTAKLAVSLQKRKDKEIQ
jgi:hypothetical protein